MFPLNPEGLYEHTFVMAMYVACGFLFGVVLEQAGFGNAKNLAAQFYLSDMRVLKVMFTAIVTAMLLVFLANAIGMLDLNLVFVNPTHLWPGIVGGLIFGVGFVIGGYCPGTSIVSAATLKIDGIFFLFGLAIGSIIFAETLPLFDEFFEASGNYGQLTLYQWLNVGPGVVVLGVVVMALGMFWAAERIETIFSGRRQ